MTQRYYPVPSAILFRASGAHATRYLHNRLSNNIRGLKIGEHCRAAALTPQGRAEAFVTILREDSERYLIYADGGEADLVRSALLRFKVADRIELESLSLKLWHLVGGIQKDFLLPEGSIVISSGRSPSGVDLISSSVIPRSFGVEISPNESTEIRIMAKWPIFPDEINGDVMLLELGLTEAVSFTKGCYVGQEVLERVDSRGRPPRILYIGQGDSLESDRVIKDASGRAIGEVITSATDRTGKAIFFALIKSAIEVRIGDTFAINSRLITIIG